eukprot:SAG25_NODE_7076_length_507_cov_1.000000_2_plen_85_part_01
MKEVLISVLVPEVRGSNSCATGAMPTSCRRCFCIVYIMCVLRAGTAPRPMAAQGSSVCELMCGSGKDLGKWQRAKLCQYVGVGAL